MSGPNWRIWEISAKIISNNHYWKESETGCCQWTSVTPCFEVGTWNVAMLWHVIDIHSFSCENHCMLWDLERNHSLHSLSRKSLTFPVKCQNIQFLFNIFRLLMVLNEMCYFWGSSSVLPPPCQHHQVELNESEPTHSVLCWLEELLGTENQHCLCSKVYFLHWGSIDLNPSRSVIIWPNCFQQKSHEIFFGCTQNKEADSQLHLSPKKGV